MWDRTSIHRHDTFSAARHYRSCSGSLRILIQISCGWAFGVNVFYLKEWRKQDITGIYHDWQNLIEDRTLWELRTLPLGLLTFYDLTYPLERSWHVLLGYDPALNQTAIENAAVVHHNGNYKPRLDLAIAKYNEASNYGRSNLLDVSFRCSTTVGAVLLRSADLGKVGRALVISLYHMVMSSICPLLITKASATWATLLGSTDPIERYENATTAMLYISIGQCDNKWDSFYYNGSWELLKYGADPLGKVSPRECTLLFQQPSRRRAPPFHARNDITSSALPHWQSIVTPQISSLNLPSKEVGDLLSFSLINIDHFRFASEKSWVTLTELIGLRFDSQRILEGLVCVCFTFVDEDLATAALTLFLLTISDDDLTAAT
ncbi:hypothetical protein Vadar_008958 [Vaccinium darrowii]|uniref:Uncharacterized protein n=1 Tax=Vaccinium darrowii TaxID=229202 RepID=A0ACB7ZAI4_9ERIC|nr:hypothetical protein Vadar_008958 [Vaccinium darrowii]